VVFGQASLDHESMPYFRLPTVGGMAGTPWCSVIGSDGVSLMFCLLISASQAARITGVSHGSLVP
jgi:hypothetical protein